MMIAKVAAYKWRVVIALLICFAFCNSLTVQSGYHLSIQSVDKDTAFIRSLGLQTVFQSRIDCNEYIDHLPSMLRGKGYISASVDTVLYDSIGAVVTLFVGEKLSAFIMSARPQDKPLINEIWWNKKGKETGSISFDEYYLLTEKLLDYFEVQGYPFAAVSLDSIETTPAGMHAVLNIDKGYSYKIDSIRVFGTARISSNFLEHYLDIAKGSLYSKEKIDKINKRILELPYLQATQPADVSMLQTGSIVNLYLQPRKSNQVNVLAGFLPSNHQLGGKLLFTIDANLQLQNAFAAGENIGLVWQQLQPKSPRLNLQYTQPYIFNSAFGVDFLFNLYKKDSAFLNINGQLGALYYLSANNVVKVLLQTQKTNVLDVDTIAVKATKRLPDVADVSALNFGVEYDVSSTDYKFNPRRGSELSVSVLAGNKTIRKNNAITAIKDTAFNYNTLYDTVKLKTYQLRLSAKAAHYFKVGKQSVVKTGVNAGWLQSPVYFRNELFQIGGYKLLRGFDEESIFTNRYAVGTIEYRYLLDLNSSFFVFTDIGWSQNKIFRQSNSYIGSGVGLSFQTKGGIFNLSYAVGKRNDLPFSIKQSKIHFGYVSIF